MELFDTHTHPYLSEFAAEEAATVNRAIEAGVTRMMMPNVDLHTLQPMKQLAEQFPANVCMALGLHPTEVGPDWEEQLATLKTELDSHPALYHAIGEVGMDLYWDATYRSEQMLAFEQQLRWAQQTGLPVIIHCRNGLEETLQVLDKVKDRPQCVFHSFGGTIDDVRAIRRHGDFFFGINGVATFKNCHVREAFAEIGLDRILLETDAPYLTPVPHRGKRNESAYMVHTARFVADAMGLPLEEVAATTTASAREFFKF